MALTLRLMARTRALGCLGIFAEWDRLRGQWLGSFELSGLYCCSSLTVSKSEVIRSEGVGPRGFKSRMHTKLTTNPGRSS